MGNSAAKKQQQIANNAATQAQATTDTLLSQQKAEEAPILSGYNQELSNPMSSEEQGARLSSTAGAFDSEAGRAAEVAGRTHNPANLTAMATRLALDKSSALGKTSADIGDTMNQRRLEALKGLSGIYGVNAGTLANFSNLSPKFLQTGEDAAAQQQSIVPSIISAGGQIGGGALML